MLRHWRPLLLTMGAAIGVGTLYYTIAVFSISYPHNWASRDAIFSKDFDGRFATGLDLLIAGVWQRIRSASTC